MDETRIPNERQILQSALQRLIHGLPLLKGTETRLVCYLMEPDDNGEDWLLTRMQGPAFTPEPLTLHIPDELFRSFYENHPTPRVLHREEIRETPLLKNFPGIETYRSFFWYPLREEQEWVAHFLFAHPGRHYFNSQRQALLGLAADMYLLTWKHRLCLRSLFHRIQRLYRLEEEVRYRLARDLHDGPAQTLSGLVMEAQYLRRLAQDDPETVLESLNELEDKARKAVNEIRQVLYILRPLALEQGAFREALEQLVARIRSTFPGEVRTEIQEQVLEHLPDEAQRHLFYLAAEALNNAAKHANAQTITLRLCMEDDGHGALEIEDDGLGFDPEQAQELRKLGHYGLLNMEERARFLKGELEIQSRPGQGTRIRVRFPLTLPAPSGEGGTETQPN